ncbi:MAG: endonuclease, partial [Arthrobacter sp.]
LAWADGGTTGIANLGQPCPKHHRLKHRSAWTPTGASKDHPPGWTSPSGRYYPSEHQDWEPPHWPEHFPGTDAGTDTDPLLDQRPSEDPGPEPDSELPPDPFPDWHHFTLCDELAAADPDDQDWLAPLGDGFLEDLMLRSS